MALLEKLEGITTAGIDTAIFIYHLEEHPVYIALTHELLSAIESGRLNGVTSGLTLLEVIERPYRLERVGIARKYEALLTNFPNLRIAPIDRTAVRRAAQVRARFDLDQDDALQLAACLTNGAQAFVTNNRALACVQPLCRVLVLDDFLA